MTMVQIQLSIYSTNNPDFAVPTFLQLQQYLVYYIGFLERPDTSASGDLLFPFFGIL